MANKDQREVFPAAPHGWRRELLFPTQEQEARLSQYTCRLCNLVLRQAVTVDCNCGWRFCEECLEYSQREPARKFRCPVCQTSVKETFADSRVRKLIDTVEAKCINAPNCDVTGKISVLNRHVKECKYGKCECPFGCGLVMLRSEVSAHGYVCPKNQTRCPQCQITVPEPTLQDHMANECLKRLVPCTYCRRNVEFQQLTSHVYEKHLEKYKADVEQLQSNVDAPCLEDEACAVLARLSTAELDLVYQELLQKLQSANDPALRADLDGLSLHDGYSSHANLLSLLLDSNDAEEIRDLSQSIDDFTRRVVSLKEQVDEDIQKLNDEEDDLDAAAKLADLESNIQKNRQWISNRTNEMDKAEKSVQYLENSTKDGIFVWKIEGWSKLLDRCKSGNEQSIYSVSFFTAPAGYRLRMRLFPNGDRDERGRSMSLYLSILRGPYDAILSWPFGKQVLVSLVDQSDYPAPRQQSNSLPGLPVERADYTCAIRPDFTKLAHLDACKRPERNSEGNSSIGFVAFIDHAQLTKPATRTVTIPANEQNKPAQRIEVTPKYIVDDTLFIRVVVEPNRQ